MGFRILGGVSGYICFYSSVRAQGNLQGFHGENLPS